MAQPGHVWTQVGLNMRNLVPCVGASGDQVGPKAGPMCMALHEPVKETLEVAVKCRFQACCIEPAKWVPTWAHVVLSRTQLEPKLEPLGEIGRKLRLRAKLRHVGGKFEPSGSKLGRILAKVDPKWSRRCCHVGSKRRIWPMMGQSAKCANYHSTPAEAVPDWQIGPFVSSVPKLSRLGTFRAGGFLLIKE